MKRTLATIFTIMLLLLQLPVQGATITGNYGDKNLLDEKGDLIFEKGYYDIRELGKDLFVVKTRNMYTPAAMVNGKGEFITDFEYYGIDPLKNGYIIATKKPLSNAPFKYGIIDDKGNIIVPFNYGTIAGAKDGMFIQNHGIKGYITVHTFGDEEIIPPNKYSMGTLAPGGISLLKSLDFKTVTAFDARGKRITEKEYTEINYVDGYLVCTRLVEDAVLGVLGGSYKSVIDIISPFGDIIVEGALSARIDNQLNPIVTVNPTKSKIILDGKYVSPEGYNINGNNYFKLRDFAMLVKDSNNKFDINWNAEEKRIDLFIGSTYSVIGGELGTTSPATKGMASYQPILIDGIRPRILKSYLINGNNYFMLRDLCDIMYVNVDWDKETNTIYLR